jgi:hypothetical protein
MSSQEDIEAVVNGCLKSNLPVWFIIRTDLNDPIDGQWSIGYYSPLTIDGDQVQYVTQFSRQLFPKCLVSYFSNPKTLEDDLWDFIFSVPAAISPTITLPPGQIYVVSDPHRSARIVPGSYGVKLSDYCVKKICCFVTVPPHDSARSNTTAVHLFNPSLQTAAECRVCGRLGSGEPHPDSTNEKTIYAFMKADIIHFLSANFPGTHYKLMADISSCGELVDPPGKTVARRRSSDDVLSPPTFEKYNKGACKRTRNFPDEDPPTVALFQ